MPGGLGFFLLGAAVAATGTLIGAGGGFLLVPILLLGLGLPAKLAVGTSLTMVFFNALAGSISYARQRRVDYGSGIWFALATIPGAVFGAHLVGWLSDERFSAVFGALLMATALFLVFRPRLPGSPAAATADRPAGRRWGTVTRTFTDGFGEEHRLRYSMPLGLAASTAVGVLSSLLGIGGGILHVPIMIYGLGFPVHVAVATSHFILAISAAVGAATHWSLGQVAPGVSVALSAGALLGAPVGAQLAPRVPERAILAVLGVALLFVGARLVWVH